MFCSYKDMAHKEEILYRYKAAMVIQVTQVTQVTPGLSDFTLSAP